MLLSIFSLQLVIPERPIRNFRYFCGKTFLTDEIQVLEEKQVMSHGLLLVTGDQCLVYKASEPDSTGRVTFEFCHKLSVSLPKGHGRGGQSAPRFQRMYLSALAAYENNIHQVTLQVFRPNGVWNIKKLLICGNGVRLQHLYEDFVGDGIDMETHVCLTLQEAEKHVKRLVSDWEQEFLTLLNMHPDLLVFGEDNILAQMREIKTVLTDASVEPLEPFDTDKSVVVGPWIKPYGTRVGIRYVANVPDLTGPEDESLVKPDEHVFYESTQPGL